MDLKQVGVMLEVINMSYPNQVKGFDEDFKVNQMRIWHGFLKDDDANAVMAIVQEHVLSSPYYPTISDIKGKLREASEPSKEMLWEEFRKAVKNSYEYYFKPDGKGSSIQVYYRDEVWKELSEPLRRIAGSAKGLEDLHYKYKDKEFELRDLFDRKISGILADMKTEMLTQHIEQTQLEYNAENVKKIEAISRSIDNGNV